MRFGSLFAGIGGFEDLDNLTSHHSIVLGGLKFVNAEQAKVCKPMTVRTQDDTVLDRVFSSVTPWEDVMSIARCLIPTTAHTSIGVQAAHCSIPRTLVGVFFLAGMSIGLPFVPGDTWTNAFYCLPCNIELLFGFILVLMVLDISAGTPPLVILWAILATATCALNLFHCQFLSAKIIASIAQVRNAIKWN